MRMYVHIYVGFQLVNMYVYQFYAGSMFYMRMCMHGTMCVHVCIPVYLGIVFKRVIVCNLIRRLMAHTVQFTLM